MFPRISDLFGENFPIPIYSFGAMVATAILVAGWLLARELDRMYRAGQVPLLHVARPVTATKAGGARRVRKMDAGVETQMPSTIVNRLVILAALGGIAGAKLFHILENLDEFAADPAGMIFSSGGLTFYGGLIVAALLIAWNVRRAGLPVGRVADAVAPGLLLGYGIGRIGCYLAGDGDWGICSRLADKPAWLPAWLWSETFPRNLMGPGQTPVDVISYTAAGMRSAGMDASVCTGASGVYPTMLYELTMCAVGFAMLWALRRHPHRAGWLFGLYMILTGIERFLIEQIRVNNVGTWFGIPATQAEVISVLFIAAGVGLVVWAMRGRDRGIAAAEPVPTP